MQDKQQKKGVKMFYQSEIVPCNGQWFTASHNASDGWQFEGDLLQAIFSAECGEIYELGKANLPEEVEDIRGLIHDEPPRVFAIVDGWQVLYFGIVEA